MPAQRDRALSRGVATKEPSHGVGQQQAHVDLPVRPWSRRGKRHGRIGRRVIPRQHPTTSCVATERNRWVRLLHRSLEASGVWSDRGELFFQHESLSRG